MAEGVTGTTSATVIVSVVPAGTPIILVDYRTVDGTGTAPSDYIATFGTLLFEASSSLVARAITVSIQGDALPEADETLFVELQNPRGATIEDARGQVTIANDDSALGADPTCGLSSQQLRQAGSVELSCVGLQPGSSASVTLESTPMPLGTYRVAASGALTANLVIPANAAPGAHTIVVVGTTNAGTPQTIRMPVTLASATSPTAQAVPAGPGAAQAPGGGGSPGSQPGNSVLPKTGASIGLIVLIAIVLILLGMRLDWIARRSRDQIVADLQTGDSMFWGIPMVDPEPTVTDVRGRARKRRPEALPRRLG